MGERRIYELQYADFSNILRKASNMKKKIEKSNKEAWTTYVRAHNVPEAAMWSRAKSGTLSGNVNGVIIDGAGAYDGFYVYCADEAFCLKLESGEE